MQQLNEITDSTSIIIISGEEENLGHITMINQQAAALFGYQAQDLLHAKIEKLMPVQFAEQHNKFLDNFLLTN
jgi:PAS domain S-box-containing protein